MQKGREGINTYGSGFSLLDGLGVSQGAAALEQAWIYLYVSLATRGSCLENKGRGWPSSGTGIRNDGPVGHWVTICSEVCCQEDDTAIWHPNTFLGNICNQFTHPAQHSWLALGEWVWTHWHSWEDRWGSWRRIKLLAEPTEIELHRKLLQPCGLWSGYISIKEF